MKLYFVRHGESEANVVMEFSNTLNKHPLTAKGVGQAQKLAESLADKEITRLISSPLLRAVQTAQILSAKLGVEMEINDALREWSVGIYEGSRDPQHWQIHNDLQVDWFYKGKLDRKIPGGESYLEIRARFAPFIEGLLQAGEGSRENIVLVGHGGLYLAMLPGLFVNITYKDVLGVREFPNTGYAVAEPRPGGCTVWNGAEIQCEFIQIRIKIRAPMKCTGCGYELAAAGGRYCPNCGRALGAAEAAQTNIAVTQQVGEVGASGTVTGVDIRQVIGNVFITAPDEERARERRNQRILLQKVKSFWIEGVLEHSVHQAVLIELDKQALPEAVQHPWEMTLQPGEQQPRPVPAGVPLLTLFEETGRAMLVMGAPGTGKTITLLELARAAILQAETSPDEPIPVVLPLSSWGVQRLPLADWLVEELNSKYQIPRPMARQWVDKDSLLILLDGLDEVVETQRRACVQAINKFREEHGLVGLAVTCRTQEYETLGERLRLDGAVRLELLNSGQIDAYLAGLGEKLQGLRAALWKDNALAELAQSPLMLSILCLTFQDLPADGETQGQEIDARRRDVFRTYIQRMFARERKRAGLFAGANHRLAVGGWRGACSSLRKAFF